MKKAARSKNKKPLNWRVYIASGFVVAQLLSSTEVIAGWSCGEVTKKTMTVGLFGNSFYNNLAQTAFMFAAVTALLCLMLLSFSRVYRRISMFTKKQNIHYWLAYSWMIVSGILSAILAYTYAHQLITLVNRALFNPSWVYSDTYGGLLSACSIINYTLNKTGKITALVLVALSIPAILLTVRKIISDNRKKPV